MVCISHAVLFFCVRKDLFNGLLALRIECFAPLRLLQLLHQIQVLLPDMSVENFLSFCVCSAFSPAWAIRAFLREDSVGSLIRVCG